MNNFYQSCICNIIYRHPMLLKIQEYAKRAKRNSKAHVYLFIFFSLRLMHDKFYNYYIKLYIYIKDSLINLIH